MEIDNYPTRKVILSYTLFGGAVGGIFIDFVMAIIEYPVYSNFDRSFINFLLSTFFYAFWGSIVGLIPAITTGLFIANREIYLDKKLNFFKIFMIGFIVSGCLTAIITFPFMFKEIFTWLKYTLMFSGIGGLK